MDDKHLKVLQTELQVLKHQMNNLEGRIDQALRTAPPFTIPSSPLVSEHKVENFEYHERPHTDHKQAAEYEGARSSVSSATFLGIVASFCFLLAAGYLIKLAVDSGWLNPLRQIGLAACLGLGLIAGGFVLRKRDAGYASILPAIGTVILYLACYGGTLYYNLYSTDAATLFASAISIFALWLYTQFKNDLFALFAIVGSYASPLFLSTNVSNLIGFSLFFLAWNITYSIVAIRLRSRAILLMASYLALGLYAFMTLPKIGFNSSELSFVAIFQLIQFLTFTFALVGYTLKNREPLNTQESWGYFPLLLLFYGMEYSILSKMYPHVTPWLGLVFTGFVYALSAWTKKSSKLATLQSHSMLNTFIYMALFHSFYLGVLPDRAAPWFALTLLALFPKINERLDVKGKDWMLGIVVLVIVGLNYFNSLVGFHQFSKLENVAVHFCFVSFLLFGYAKTKFGFLPYLAHVQALFGLHRISQLIFPNTPEVTFITSSAWGFFAIAILVWGMKTKNRPLAQSALFLFGFTAAKLLLFDLSSSTTGIRIIGLLGIGILFYVGGLLYRRMSSWK